MNASVSPKDFAWLEFWACFGMVRGCDVVAGTRGLRVYLNCAFGAFGVRGGRGGWLGLLAVRADAWAARLDFPLDIWKNPFPMGFSWGWPCTGGSRGCEFGSWPGVVDG